jgi:hypothetical protein
MNVDWFLEQFRGESEITVSRWGDGEWRAVLAKTAGFNCDGHPFSQGLTDLLCDVLREQPSYLMGMQGLAMRGWGNKIEAWLRDNVKEEFDWFNADVFHHAAIKGRLSDIYEATKARPIVLIGPKHMANVFEDAKHILVPDKGAFKARNRILEETRPLLDAAGSGVMVSVSAGMTAEFLIHELHKTHGGKHTIVDFGSLWDPLGGVKSRTYMKNAK